MQQKRRLSKWWQVQQIKAISFFLFYFSDRGRLNEDPIVEFMSFKVIYYLAFIVSTKNNTSECKYLHMYLTGKRSTRWERSLMFVNISTHKLNIELIIRQKLECDIAIKEVQIIYRLFLVNCYLLHVPRLSSQPASNMRDLVIHWTGLNWLDST